MADGCQDWCSCTADLCSGVKLLPLQSCRCSHGPQQLCNGAAVLLAHANPSCLGVQEINSCSATSPALAPLPGVPGAQQPHNAAALLPADNGPCL